MKGIRFYLEYADKKEKAKATVKNPGNHTGNCVAVFTEYRNHATMDAIGAVYYTPNSPVASTGISMDYIREKCKRIPASMVKDIHPKLWYYLQD
jgi:hypothetical protein